MSDSPQARTAGANRPLLAPPWHTALLCGLFISVAGIGALGTLLHGAEQTAPHHRLLTVYLPLIAVQWGLLIYACSADRALLLTLLGSPEAPWRALALGALTCAAFILVSSLLGPAASAATLALLPQGLVEKLAWIGVALSAGFCEEVVFRGYLQRQLGALSGRAGAGLVLQAAFFGIAHGYQGAAAAAQTFFFGLALGALAQWRASLWPGIAGHALLDLAGGLLGG